MLEHNFVMAHLTFAERESNLIFVPAGRRIFSMCHANSLAKQDRVIRVELDHGQHSFMRYGDAQPDAQVVFDKQEVQMALNRQRLNESNHPRTARFSGEHTVVLDTGGPTVLAMGGLSENGAQFTADFWEEIHHENHPGEEFKMRTLDYSPDGAGSGFVSVLNREALG